MLKTTFSFEKIQIYMFMYMYQILFFFHIYTLVTFAEVLEYYLVCSAEQPSPFSSDLKEAEKIIEDIGVAQQMIANMADPFYQKTEVHFSCSIFIIQ